MEKVEIIFSILLDIKTYLGVTIKLCSIPRKPGTWDAELAWASKRQKNFVVLILKVARIAHLYHSWMEKTLNGMVTI